MKTLNIFLLFLVALFASFQTNQATAGEARGIVWMTNYDKAVALAKPTFKPIVLFFTGSDWCGWCTKLEKEVFESEEFVTAALDKMIFVKLDFPMRTKLDPEISAQNEKLKKKFTVRSFPTVVIVDADQQPIGVTGYRAGGGKLYAQHLIKMVNEYTAYKKQMERLGAHPFSGKELKRLYQKARELGLENDTNLLIRVGANSDQAHFFLVERYRHLVASDQLNSKEASDIKARLVEGDPDNRHLTHYQIAIIEFEALSEKMDANNIPPEKVVSPLVSYLFKFGPEDKENLWRLNMVISQVYLERSEYDDALKYAEDSYAAAPPSIQPEIAMAVKNIQTLLSSETQSQ